MTGGSSGIGRAVGIELGRRGMQVFLVGRNQTNLASAADEISACGGAGGYGVGDVSAENDVLRLFGEAEAFLGGPPDVLVANAGTGRFGPLETVSTQDFDLSFSTNVRGVFLWLKACLPTMKSANRGQIVVMSSVMGVRVGPNASTYAATKWALQGMLGCLRQELKGTMVKCGTVNPGAVATPWWMEKERGGKPEVASPEKLATMLTAEDVATATMSLVDQADTSNIESLVLENDNV